MNEEIRNQFAKRIEDLESELELDPDKWESFSIAKGLKEGVDSLLKDVGRALHPQASYDSPGKLHQLIRHGGILQTGVNRGKISASMRESIARLFIATRFQNKLEDRIKALEQVSAVVRKRTAGERSQSGRSDLPSGRAVTEPGSSTIAPQEEKPISPAAERLEALQYSLSEFGGHHQRQGSRSQQPPYNDPTTNQSLFPQLHAPPSAPFHPPSADLPPPSQPMTPFGHALRDEPPSPHERSPSLPPILRPPISLEPSSGSNNLRVILTALAPFDEYRTDDRVPATQLLLASNAPDPELSWPSSSVRLPSHSPRTQSLLDSLTENPSTPAAAAAVRHLSQSPSPQSQGQNRRP